MKTHALAVASLVALSVPTAAAAQETIVRGAFSILVLNGSTFTGCLVKGERDGHSPYALSYADPQCRSQPNGQDIHLWDVQAIRNPSGYPQWVHVIRNRVDGKCLIRGDNGTSGWTITYLWSDSADKTYCGFVSAQALVANGQATWDLSGFALGSLPNNAFPTFTGALRAPAYSDGYLTWNGLHTFPFFSKYGPGAWRVTFAAQPR